MIDLENVCFSYTSNEKEASVKNINLHVAQGEAIVLCGKSGCGKTTITRLLNGLIPDYYNGVLSGKIKIDNRDTKGLEIYEYMGKVGSVFQNPRSQFYSINTTDELAFGCENMGLHKEETLKRIGRTIGMFGICDLMNKSLFALSGGEKQKIACASVSAMEPDILVLDEPSSNLDIAAIESLRKVIETWKRTGKTIVIAEHRLYWLRALADKYVYLREGKIDRIFTKDEFSQLEDRTRHEMGLRSIDPFTIHEVFPDIKNNSTINVSNLKFAYQKKPLLDIDNLFFNSNAVIGILGNNGAGKTTFAKCLCGLEKKARGTVILSGKKLKLKQCIHRCYMVMQDVNHQLFTESVLDEVLLSMDSENEKENEQRAKQILWELNLGEKTSLHPMSLSGGEKQRVAIASAIASSKEIIIFDEPTSGLDYENMKEVAKQINRLRDIGKTVLLISHDPELIYLCCTQIILFEEGKVSWVETMSSDCVKEINHFFNRTIERDECLPDCVGFQSN